MANVPTTCVQELPPLLASVKEVGRLLGGISPRTVWTMNETGALGPRPLKLNKRSLWRVDELQAWVQADCPRRELWTDTRGRRKKT